jgi:hypothetical protein
LGRLYLQSLLRESQKLLFRFDSLFQVTRRRPALHCEVATTSFTPSTIQKSDDGGIRTTGQDTGSGIVAIVEMMVVDVDAPRTTMLRHSRPACTTMRHVHHGEDVIPIQKNDLIHLRARIKAKSCSRVEDHDAIDPHPPGATATVTI